MEGGHFFAVAVLFDGADGFEFDAFGLDRGDEGGDVLFALLVGSVLAKKSIWPSSVMTMRKVCMGLSP